MTITCSIRKQTLDGGPNQTHNLFVRSNQVFFIPHLLGKIYLINDFHPREKVYYHYKLQTTNSTKLSFSKTLQTILHQYKAILENTSIKLQDSDYQVET